jgi:poly(A) polymerase
VKREDFFEIMYDVLKLRSEVSEITVYSLIRVFLMHMFLSLSWSFLKFMYLVLMQIDLVFARLGLPAVPDDLTLSDDNLLKNLDERCVRSLNGSLVD